MAKLKHFLGNVSMKDAKTEKFGTDGSWIWLVTPETEFEDGVFSVELPKKTGKQFSGITLMTLGLLLIAVSGDVSQSLMGVVIAVGVLMVIVGHTYANRR